MLDRRSSLAAALLAIAACSFDGGGVSDDDPEIDGGGSPGDEDGDDVEDEVDNCRETPNPGQEDEDSDDVGNACDNCPHVGNPDQANDGETTAGAASDGAGDVCDPQPTEAGNDILVFEGFDDPDALDGWAVDVDGGDWSIAGGALHQTSTASHHTLYYQGQRFGGVVVDLRITVDGLSSAVAGRAFGALTAYTPGPFAGAGYYCFAHSTTEAASPNGTLKIWTLRGSQPTQEEDSEYLAADLAIEGTYDLRAVNDVGDNSVRCQLSSSLLTSSFTAQATDGTYDGGLVAIRTQLLAGHVDHLVVFSIAP